MGRVDRAALAVACAAQAAEVNAAGAQGLHHRGRSVRGQPQVVVVGAALVGVALNLDQGDLRVADQRGRDRVDDRERTRQDLGAVGREVDLLEDDDLVFLDDDVAAVGAAVLVLEAVVGLRVIRARVVDVEDAVLVVVRVRAAVLVLEVVLVLGVVRAKVVDV